MVVAGARSEDYTATDGAKIDSYPGAQESWLQYRFGEKAWNCAGTENRVGGVTEVHAAAVLAGLEPVAPAFSLVGIRKRFLVRV